MLITQILEVHLHIQTAASQFDQRLLNTVSASEILYDRERKFVNDLFPQLSKYCGIKRLKTNPYHPQTTGQTERMKQTILEMLKTHTTVQNIRQPVIPLIICVWSCSLLTF